MITIDNTGIIRINSGNLSEYVREPYDPTISAIAMEYLLPEGCSPDDVLFDPEQRALILSRSNTQLRVEIEGAVLIVSGPIKWDGVVHHDETNELAHHLKEVEQVLSGLAKIGTNTELTLGRLRHVKYKCDRSLESVESLRDVHDYWRVHSQIDTKYDLPEYGDGPVKVKHDDYFGFCGGESELRFCWVPKNLTTRCILSDDGWKYTEVAANALIRCEIRCSADALLQALGLERELTACEAAELALEVFRAFLAPLVIPDVLVVGKVVHLGALIDPWRLFFGQTPKD